MPIERWWDQRPDEIFWLEVTNREDLGADLRAPQENGSGQEYWSYSLVPEVADGDIVFHYSKRDFAIRLWSRAAGGWWEEDIFWGARGTVGRSSLPYDRPGWCHGLDGPFELRAAVTLADVRAAEPKIRSARDRLLGEVGPPLYFPFELGDARPLRAAQWYLFKFPASVVRIIPDLAAVGAAAPPDISPRPGGTSGIVGSTYRRPTENVSTGARQPFDVDPNVVDRGVAGHMRAQNRLYDHLVGLGLDPRSPAPVDPSFDLAWLSDQVLWVAEVKSLTRKNEERQLRLGLGQLLRYRHLLARRGGKVHAALMVEREPTDRTWDELCGSLGILLIWPGVLRERLPA